MTYRGYDAYAYKLLAVSGVRRLMPQRMSTHRYGADARQEIRRCIADLRALRAMGI